MPPPRRPFRDNPRLILAGIAVLVGVLIAILVVAERTSRLSPDFLTEVVLYALSAIDVMMLLALVFVLARNIIKLLVERRRAIPFARFRAKLVFVLLGMTLVPALLVLLVGSNVVLRAMGQWFNAPVEEVLSSASQLAANYYEERRQAVVEHAGAPGRGPHDRGPDLDRSPPSPRAAHSGRQRAADRDRSGLPRETAARRRVRRRAAG